MDHYVYNIRPINGKGNWLYARIYVFSTALDIGRILCTGLFALIMAESYTKSVGGKNISPEMLVQRMNHEKAVVVDLRDAEQFKQSHIINAINIPSGEFDQKIMRLNSFKQQPLVLVCGSQAMPSDLLKNYFVRVLRMCGF